MSASWWQRLKAGIATPVIRFLAENSYFDFASSYARRRPGMALQSSDADANWGTREEMLSDARDLCRVTGITKRILRSYANQCVGSCEIDWSTGRDDWDEQAEQYWRDVMNIIDARGRQHFRGLAKLGVRSMIRDGDVAWIKRKVGNTPQLIPVEADRIRTDIGMNADRDDNIIGGIKVDDVGRATSYRIWNRSLTINFRDPQWYPAAQVLHMMDPDRYDGVRGITHFAGAALNHIRDIKEIVEAEKRGVKGAAKLALIVKKLAGGPVPTTINLFGQKADRTGNQYTEELPDGTIKYLLPGEDIIPFQSNRPSPAWNGFMEWLLREVSTALDLPYSWIWSMAGLTGPAVRLESKQAEQTFKHTIDVLEFSFLYPVASWVIMDAMENKIIDWNPFWYQFSFQRPSHPSIDIGRESKADLEEHARGWTSGSEMSASRGTNFYRNVRSKAREYRYVLDTAKEFDVPPGALCDIGQAKAPAPPGAMPKRPGAEEEPEPEDETAPEENDSEGTEQENTEDEPA